MMLSFLSRYLRKRRMKNFFLKSPHLEIAQKLFIEAEKAFKEIDDKYKVNECKFCQDTGYMHRLNGPIETLSFKQVPCTFCTCNPLRVLGIRGTGRDDEDEKTLIIHFSRRLTNDEIREIHDLLCENIEE